MPIIIGERWGRTMTEVDTSKRSDAVSNSLEKRLEVILLLQDWWLTTTANLTENVGSEAALQTLRPFWENGGRASAYNLRQMTGISSDDVPSITALLMTQRNPEGFKWGIRGRAGIKAAIIELQCPYFPARPPIKEVCLTICGYSANGTIEALNPDYVCNLVRSLSFGDNDCCWVIKRRDGFGFDEDEDKFQEVEPATIVENIFNNLAMAYIGEFWIYSTRALLEHLDNERAIEILISPMRNKGREFGEKKKGHSDPIMEDPNLIIQLIDEMEEMNYKNGMLTKTSGFAGEKEIVDCPFSSGPPEICLQFQFFYNGICEAINPDYEFAYDRMMTKGDKTCHWTIRKKGEPVMERAKEEAPSDDLAKRLGQKYIDGEITAEELEKKLAHLKKLGLVK